MKEFIFKSISVFNHIKKNQPKVQMPHFGMQGMQQIIASVLFDFLQLYVLSAFKKIINFKYF